MDDDGECDDNDDDNNDDGNYDDDDDDDGDDDGNDGEQNDDSIYLDHIYRFMVRNRYSQFLVGGMVEPGVEHLPAYVFDSDNAWKLDQDIEWQNGLKASPDDNNV